MNNAAAKSESDDGKFTENRAGPIPLSSAATRLIPWSMGALMCGLVLACYWPALHGGLVWDDQAHVTAPDLRSWAGLGRIWFEVGATQQYYPILHSAFWVEHRLWGDTTLGYHLVNVLLHAVSSCLLAFVLRRLWTLGLSGSGGAKRAMPVGTEWLAALLFAVHPVYVESVAWISEQKNTLSLVFYLGAAFVYLDFSAKRRLRSYWLATGIFLLALGTKSVTATLPAALLVVFWWRKGGVNWRRDVVPLLPWFVVGLVAGLFTAWVERKFIGAEGAAFDLSAPQRVMLAGRVIWFYLGKLFWPTDLMFVYPRWDVPIAWTGWFGYLAGAVLATAGLWLIRRRWRGPLAAWLFFGGSLFPVLGFVNVYPFLFSYVADHFQYLASIGVVAATATGLALLVARAPRPLRVGGWIACGLLVMALGVLTHRQSRIYADAATLYRATLERNPACWLAHNNLAYLLASVPSGVPEAIKHYEEALRVRPGYAEAHMNLAGELVKLPGQLPVAMRHYEQALQINPKYTEAHYNLANVLAVTPGREPEALAHYEQALLLKPDFAQAHVNLANELAKLPARVPEALVHYEQALRLKPDLPEAHHNYAAELAKLPGRTSDAVSHYEQALRLEPDLAETHLNLADLLAALPGREAEAVVQYGRALSLRADFVEADVNVGNLLARLPGRQSEALAHYEHALRLNPNLAEVHYDLAVQYSNLPGHEADAQFNYQEALRLKPNYPAAHNNLAILFAQQGRSEEARKHWEEALRLNPKFDDARRNLELLKKLENR